MTPLFTYFSETSLRKSYENLEEDDFNFEMMDVNDFTSSPSEEEEEDDMTTEDDYMDETEEEECK